jgi:membrane protease YdiL (CAAX protease family)
MYNAYAKARMAPDGRGHPSPWVAAANELSLALCVPLVLYLLLLSVVLWGDPLSPAAAVLLKTCLGTGVFAAGGYLLMRRQRHHQLKLAPRLNRQNVMRLLLSVLAGCALMTMFIITKPLFGPINNPGFLDLVVSTRGLVGLMLPLWIVHAFGEELFFRAYLYNDLKGRMPVHAAMLANALLFSVLHAPHSLHYFLFLLCCSLAITAAYEHLDSLAYPTMLHAAINIFAHATLHRSIVLQNPIRWSVWSVIIMTSLLLAALAYRRFFSDSRVQSRA